MLRNMNLKFIRAPKGIDLPQNTKLKVTKGYLTDTSSPYGQNLKCYELERNYKVIIGEKGGFIWLKNNKEIINNSTTTINNPSVNSIPTLHDNPRIEYIKAPTGLDVPKGTKLYVLNTKITDSSCPYGRWKTIL